jgi:hypothetical protein
VKDDLDDLKTKIDATGKADFSGIENPHQVTGILKLYLRELPDPLLTSAKYDDFIATVST